MRPTTQTSPQTNSPGSPGPTAPSSIPQIASLFAILVGAVLFVVTILRIDRQGALQYAQRLGLYLPLVLLPGACWHLLRTWGWSVAFPDDARPPFRRLFRVRLAADALSYFTVRGLTGEPLKVLLLYDRTPPNIATAAIAAERIAIAVMSLVVAALVSHLAVRSLVLTQGWNAAFTSLSVLAVAALAIATIVARHRHGDYFGRFVAFLQRLTGRHLEASRAIRFVLDVEDVLLTLLRGSRRRLITLTWLPVVCYAINAFEVWLIFWVIGEPVGITESLAIETFTRVASIAGAAVPASLGTLEASHTVIAAALGLNGGSALAVARRLRSLLWAGVGLALYPRPRRAAAAP